MDVNPLKFAGAAWIETRDVKAQASLMAGFNTTRFAAHGLTTRFVYDELLLLQKAQLDGIHLWQEHRPAVMMTVLKGEAFIAAVDFRKRRKSFLHKIEALASGLQIKHLYLPAGVGFGLCALASDTLIQIRYSRYVEAENHHVLCYDDKALSVNWPVKHPHLTPRSENGQLVDDIFAKS